MVPIYFSYISKKFLRVFFVAILGFVFILFSLKLDDIARFATYGAPLSTIALFAAYQIPFLLQVVVPLAAVLASFITMQSMSQTNEITAFRSQGFSFAKLFLPIIIWGLFFSAANFWIVSDISVNAHRLINRLKGDIQSVNPLHLLNNSQLMNMKGYYFTYLGPSKTGMFAEDAFLAMPQQNQRMHLLTTKRVDVEQNTLALTSPLLIAATPDDALLIESAGQSLSKLPDLKKILIERIRPPKIDQICFRHLLAVIHSDYIAHKNPFTDQETSAHYAELMRRTSTSLSPIFLAILGAALGVHVGRKKHHWKTLTAAGATALYLCFYFFAKNFSGNFLLVSTLYTLPLFIILLLSIISVKRLNKGIT